MLKSVDHLDILLQLLQSLSSLITSDAEKRWSPRAGVAAYAAEYSGLITSDAEKRWSHLQKYG